MSVFESGRETAPWNYGAGSAAAGWTNRTGVEWFADGWMPSKPRKQYETRLSLP